MISIREKVFETNSSSCHSLTILGASKETLERFNDNELFYCYIPTSIGKGDNFYTAGEICGALILLGCQGVETIRFTGYDSYNFTEGEITDIWNDGNESDRADRLNYLKWFFKNLSPEMIEWTFSEDPEPKFLSRKLLKLTIETLIEENFSSPIVKVKDLFDIHKNWGVCSIYRTDSSEVFMNGETKQLEPYNKNKDTYDIILEFRN